MTLASEKGRDDGMYPFSFGATMLLMAFIAAAPAGAEVAHPDRILEGLHSQERATQDEAHTSAVLARRMAVEALVDIVKRGISSKDLGKRHAATLAIDILGELRAPEAVGVLADGMKFMEQESEFAIADLKRNVYPAMGALKKIGLPALDEMRKRLSWQHPSWKLCDYGYVMLEIDFGLGARYLHDFINSAEKSGQAETLREKKESLERLLERMAEFRRHHDDAMASERPLDRSRDATRGPDSAPEATSLPADDTTHAQAANPMASGMRPAALKSDGDNGSPAAVTPPQAARGTRAGADRTSVHVVIGLAVGLFLGIVGAWLSMRKRLRG